jgi:hypothetical protein
MNSKSLKLDFKEVHFIRKNSQTIMTTPKSLSTLNIKMIARITLRKAQKADQGILIAT